jgi:transcriptional regulator with XRE-family HTH domain
LADKLGVSKSFLSEIESAKKRPSLDLLSQYATEFDVPLSSLMFFAESVAAKGIVRQSDRVAPKVLSLLNWIAATREVPPVATRKPAQKQSTPDRKKTRFGT